MSKTFCLASAKGGSGKTVLCASFGVFLTALNKRVVLIDSDAATHGLTFLYLNEIKDHREKQLSAFQNPQGLFDKQQFLGDTDIVQLSDKLDLLPATFEFTFKEEIKGGEFLNRLQQFLAYVRLKYDYILIDAQAGTDIFSRMVMHKSVSDEVIIVSEYDPMSAAGIERIKGLLREDLGFDRTWVLLNKILPDFANAYRDFLKHEKYLSPIPWDADVVRAYSERRIALDVVNGNPFTLAVMQTIKGLLGKEMAPEIEKWVETRSAVLREPIEQQYADLEKKLYGLIQIEKENEHILARGWIKKVYTYAFPLLLVVMTTLILTRYVNKAVFGISSEFETTIISLLAGVFGIAATIYTFFFWKRKLNTSELEITRSRLSRQRELFEEQLKKLEVLRNADIHTLVKSKRSDNAFSQ